MSLLNYQMKVNNLKAKDNFYSAETVLDEIRSYMGTQISESVGNAYENVLQNYSSTSAEEKTSKLRYYFLTDMQSKYMLAGSTDTNYYDLTKFFGTDCLTPEVRRRTVLEWLAENLSGREWHGKSDRPQRTGSNRCRKSQRKNETI